MKSVEMFNIVCSLCFFFFFFQAEDGIRDLTVTGVQTCALPIYRLLVHHRVRAAPVDLGDRLVVLGVDDDDVVPTDRAERHVVRRKGVRRPVECPDRKSTHLNSSHSQISYAVFCLKKKNKTFIRKAPATGLIPSQTQPFASTVSRFTSCSFILRLPAPVQSVFAVPATLAFPSSSTP